MDEQIRTELARRAEKADVSSGARDRVLAGVRPRRRWVRPVLGSAVAVAATVALVAVVAPDAPLPTTDPVPSGSSSTADDAVGARQWREESWRGLTLSVPADWGWSAAPVGRNLLCDDRPDAPGHVGRPVFLTDACLKYRAGEFPLGEETPYVWLGTDLEPGVVELPAEGWVQETVVAEGVTLTVASDDADLRGRILASARPTQACAPELPGVPRSSQSVEEGAVADVVPEEMTVCAYRRIEGEVVLVYAARRDDVVTPTWSAISTGPFGTYRCGVSGPGNEWVVLRFSGRGPTGEDATVEAVLSVGGPVCPTIDIGSGGGALQPRMLEPWADRGIPFTLYGPSGGKGAMVDSFIPGWG